jgi:hypothetical protein
MEDVVSRKTSAPQESSMPINRHQFLLVLLAVLAIAGIAADYKWTGQCTQCGKEYRQNNPPVLARIPAGANRGRP